MYRTAVWRSSYILINSMLDEEDNLLAKIINSY